MTTTIYLTRHGQTEWNVEGRMQGWGDSSLTPLGIEQAKWLRDVICDMHIDIIYSSTSGRAYNTAQIINEKKQVKIIKDKDLREIKLGNFQGLLQKEIKEKYETQYDLYYNNPDKYVPSGDGETFAELCNRANNVVNKIINENQGKKILIVSHTMIIKAIICRINGISIKNFWDKPYIRQGSLTTICVNKDGYEIINCADISHHKYLVKEFNEK